MCRPRHGAAGDSRALIPEMIREKLRRKGMPEDLGYLATVESVDSGHEPAKYGF